MMTEGFKVPAMAVLPGRSGDVELFPSASLTRGSSACWLTVCRAVPIRRVSVARQAW